MGKKLKYMLPILIAAMFFGDLLLLGLVPTLLSAVPMARSLTLSIAIVLTGPIALADENVLEEVIVTANKREQTVQDIPMNISVLDSLAIEERGIYRPEDYLRTLAGVSTPGGDEYFIIRGLNTTTAQQSAGTTTSFVNEIALDLTNLYDIERIEVLRGPQGTLYGASAVGGTIRYLTKQPDAAGFEGNGLSNTSTRNLPLSQVIPSTLC